MSILELNTIRKLTFGHEEIAAVLGITPASARVTATRYVGLGLLLQLKRNCYILRDVWRRLELEQKFSIAAILQTPSFISFTTALVYYNITTQVQQDFIESAALQRTKTIAVESTVFSYTKLHPNLYRHFGRADKFFIAEPEKAVPDALYLHSMGKYRLDISAVDFGKLNRSRLATFAECFPLKVNQLSLRLYDEFEA